MSDVIQSRTSFILTGAVASLIFCFCAQAAPEKPQGTPLHADKASDFNTDGFVDDADFALFGIQYNTMLCNEPGMILDCAADLNHDGQVDDADFVVFSRAYAQVAPNIS